MQNKKKDKRMKENLRYKHIFIITYGRSGSTLLQGILNSIKGVEIKGENNGALRGLVNSIRLLENAKRQYSGISEQTTSPWYGIQEVDIDAYISALGAAFRKNVMKPSEQCKVCGFKEIRYHGMNKEGILREMSIIERMFSKTAFLFNVRDLESVIESNIKAKHNIKIGEIFELDRIMKSIIIKEEKENVFLVEYDKYVSNLNNLKSMYEFIGAQFDLPAIEGVMSRIHSTVSR